MTATVEQVIKELRALGLRAEPVSRYPNGINIFQRVGDAVYDTAWLTKEGDWVWGYHYQFSYVPDEDDDASVVASKISETIP